MLSMKSALLPIIMFTGFSVQVSAIETIQQADTYFEMVAAADPHAGHHHGAAVSASTATADGTIEGVDAANRSINISHDPIPALGWPAMTMDLGVTNRVDLQQFKSGDKVTFDIKKGRDNVFRITNMRPAE